jgi:energy-coupling factor transporter ATP-binding protein EcfA2
LTDANKAPDPLEALDALHAAIAAARVLQLDVEPAESVRAEAAERLGLAPDAYVVALVGGTGVGKSTLLNALAGRSVSAASARRPTTDRPVAWVPAGLAADGTQLAPLLQRLGTTTVVEHDGSGLGKVVVLDLPDIDSVEPGHRAAVEAALPKVDVVAWVTDPEKYADAVFHDSFLRDWMGRLDRQVVILNKADRLEGDAARSVSADFGALLRRELPALARRPPVVIATTAKGGADGVAAFRHWLADAVDAKAIVAARIGAAASAAVADLAGQAGVGAEEAKATTTPVIPAADRQRAIDAAIDEVLRLVDLPGAARQAVAATRAQARRRGTGPIGLLTTAIYRASGRNRVSANPAGYLRDWRSRGGLARAAELIRGVVNDALPRIPSTLRPQFAAAARTSDFEQRTAASLDRIIAAQPPLDPPSSRLWPVLGLLQTANTLLLVFAAAWTVIWIIARPDVASYDLPILGPIPAPLVLLAIGVIAGYVLARLLALHAGWLGRRWARRVSGEIRSAVRDTVVADAFAQIEAIEAARASLGAAWRRVLQSRRH